MLPLLFPLPLSLPSPATVHLFVPLLLPRSSYYYHRACACADPSGTLLEILRNLCSTLVQYQLHLTRHPIIAAPPHPPIPTHCAVILTPSFSYFFFLLRSIGSFNVMLNSAYKAQQCFLVGPYAFPSSSSSCSLRSLIAPRGDSPSPSPSLSLSALRGEFLSLSLSLSLSLCIFYLSH